MSETILCVDVDHQLLQILERVLGDEGYRPLIAHDGEQALQLLESERPALVLLDIALPRRDGFDVLQAIRSRSDAAARTPVVLTSGGRITPEYEERARLLDAQEMLAKPVPLTQWLSCVREYVKQIPPAAESRTPLGADEELSGRLCELGFPHLLHRLHGLRATGVLMLSSGRKKKAIEMRDGYPVAVKSNLIDECLGSHLVRAGRLSEEAITESLARMKRGEGLQGQILVAMEVITDEEIGEALRQQAEDKLFQIFEWKRGSFKLERPRTLKRGSTLALDSSPANIILEGVRRRAPIDVIDAFLTRNAARNVHASETPFYRFQEVDLSATDRTLVEGLDPECGLGDLIDDDEDRRRTLYALLATEMLELGPEASAAEVSRVADTEMELGDASQTRSELVAMARRLRGQDYFEILGVTDADSSETVKQAWQRLAKQAHPDRHKRASPTVRHLADDVFGMLSEAYETLSNPTRREAYRAKLARGGRSAAARERAHPPACAEAEFQRGEELLRQRDYEQALAHFRRAREAAPRDGLYLAHYGWTLHLCNADDATVAQEALAHLKRAVRLARDQEKPYLFLGRLCKVVGDGQGAEGMFTRAVQIRPDCVEAIRELRLINMRRGKGRTLIGKLLRR